MRKAKSSKSFDDETIAARIPIREMVIDDYQGHVSDGLVKKIADNWDDSAAGAIILNLREDNSYAVLDGQHRVLAARQKGVDELSALVFIGKTKEEEAKLFVQLNTKHNVRPVDRFRANLIAGNLTEKNIRHILREVGLDVGLAGPKDDHIPSIGRLVKIYSDFGGQHLRIVVGVLTSAFHGYPDRQRGYNSCCLDAVSQFVHRYPQASLPRLIEKMRQTGPTVLIGMAESKRDPGRAPWIAYGKVLTNLYNVGYRTTSAKYLPPDVWDRKIFTPSGKEVAATTGKAKLIKIQESGAAKATQFKKGYDPRRNKIAAKTAPAETNK